MKCILCKVFQKAWYEQALLIIQKSEPVLSAQFLELCHDTVGDIGNALGVQAVHHPLHNVHLVLDGKVDEIRVHCKSIDPFRCSQGRVGTMDALAMYNF